MDELFSQSEDTEENYIFPELSGSNNKEAASKPVNNETEGKGEVKNSDEEDENEEDLEEIEGMEMTEQEREEEREKMKILMENFDQAQQKRYESYRRSGLSKGAVKRLMINVTGQQSIPQNSIMIMAGIAKVFVGEVVEKALEIKDNWNEVGPLRPRHLREAYRVLKKEGKTVAPYRKRNFD